MERTVSTHEYPANNAHAHKFTTQYGMVTSKTVQFHYDEKKHEVAAILRTFEPSAPRLQRPRSR